MIKSARPYVLKMSTPSDPLKRFEEALPHSREGLLKLWAMLAPRVRAADPGRYFAVQEALEQDIPFPVLVLYVFRECRRALEDNLAQERAAK
ncbi:MAG: hypothetical protein N2Z75_07160 [Meiothermus sp.]|uniref:hypothetical protein n=1 Tax=Meiothermus sp. TaxID=1955249 RepID=UPI0025D807B2|nr:hypothetical protein [Meiothermus sp.]MCS7068114.1 hypothetical protein [Meiothermus sp.]MCX7601702.1 hypothetical protein [Meiothermus sp.]MDW8425584.1 hypothetical protein [Meiothermus sp.]